MQTLPDLDGLERIGFKNGLDAFGVAKAKQFTSVLNILQERKSQGLHAGMEFTYRNPTRSTTPTITMPEAQSLIVGARTYWKPEQQRLPQSKPLGRVALYAQEDHYKKLKEGLSAIATELKKNGFKARILVDDNALVDREAAYQAGIGWYGKNANILIPRRGSWFMLGSVLTDAKFETNSPIEESCGSCTNCIDACPTQAIVSPGVIDGNRCLAWLVQSAEDFPHEFREALGDRIYGCDDCQDVCPINKFEERIDGPRGTRENHYVSIHNILEQDDQSLLSNYGQWYIPKRDPRYLRRNALLVLGNMGKPTDRRTQRVVKRWLSSSDSMLRSYAVWTAKRLGLTSLLTGMGNDPSRDVQRELSQKVDTNHKEFPIDNSGSHGG